MNYIKIICNAGAPLNSVIYVAENMIKTLEYKISIIHRSKHNNTDHFRRLENSLFNEIVLLNDFLNAVR
jgi:hypothetical protein